MPDKEIKRVFLPPVMTDEQADKLGGTFLEKKYIKHLFEEDIDVFCEGTGALILKFRKGLLPIKPCIAAYKALRNAAAETDNRGMAAGFDHQQALIEARRSGGVDIQTDPNSNRYKIVFKNGTVSNTFRAVKVKSGIIGYMDRFTRIPYCRQTAFNEKNFRKFANAYPLIKTVDNYYKKLCPEPYALQRAEADKTAQDFVIKDTAFTTVTVNKNFRTACHKDAGDFEEGFGNLVVLEAGEYKGGYFVIPKWGVAVNPRTRDMLFADVHQWHGNTSILPTGSRPYERISLVMYYRKNMISCGTAEEERVRAATYGAKGLNKAITDQNDS